MPPLLPTPVTASNRRQRRTPPSQPPFPSLPAPLLPPLLPPLRRFRQLQLRPYRTATPVPTVPAECYGDIYGNLHVQQSRHRRALAAYPGPVSTIDELIAADRTVCPPVTSPRNSPTAWSRSSTMRRSRSTKVTPPPPRTCCRAFQHEVAAQSGKKIAADAATFLTASADNVIANLQQDQPGGSESPAAITAAITARAMTRIRAMTRAATRATATGKGTAMGRAMGTATVAKWQGQGPRQRLSSLEPPIRPLGCKGIYSTRRLFGARIICIRIRCSEF